MGVVYEAEQVSLGRHVALKVLPPQMLRDAKQQRRFEREAKAAAKLHHTNIVPVFGVGEHDGTPYYVMQFIQGLGLDEVLDELQAACRPAAGPCGRADADGEPADGRGRDVSAADVARSLLTGRFEPGRPEATPIPGGGRTATQARRRRPWTAPGRHAVRRLDRARRRRRFVRRSRRRPSLLGREAPGDGRRQARRSTLLAERGPARRAGRRRPGLRPQAGRSSTATSSRRTCCSTPRGTVWVTDFGLAKADDQQNLTHTGDILGTLRYMPPEAFEGKSDARSDVYSLGPDALRAAAPSGRPSTRRTAAG